MDALRAAVRKTKDAHPFEIVAWVVLPEHLHALWGLPTDDADYSMRWNQMKGAFSRALPATEWISAARRTKRERGIWQRRFWEHQIRGNRDLEHHVNDVHYNPVKHGYVEQAAQWPYSSIHRHIRCGDLPADWGCRDDWTAGYGEREPAGPR